MIRAEGDWEADDLKKFLLSAKIILSTRPYCTSNCYSDLCDCKPVHYYGWRETDISEKYKKYFEGEK